LDEERARYYVITNTGAGYTFGNAKRQAQSLPPRVGARSKFNVSVFIVHPVPRSSRRQKPKRGESGIIIVVAVTLRWHNVVASGSRGNP